MTDKTKANGASDISETDQLLDSIGWSLIIKDPDTRQMLQSKYPRLMHQNMPVEPKRFNNKELVEIGQGQAIRAGLYNHVVNAVRSRTAVFEGLCYGVMTLVTIVCLLFAWGHISTDMDKTFENAKNHALSLVMSKEQVEAMRQAQDAQAQVAERQNQILNRFQQLQQ